MNFALKQTLALLVRYFRPQRGRVLLLALLLLGSIALQLINPQLVRAVVDTAQSGTTTVRIVLAALLFILFGLGQAALNLGASYVGEKVSWAATNALRSDLALHILQLDMDFHNSHTPGELIERVDGDVSQLASFFSQLTLRVVASALLILGVIALLWLEDWRMGLAGVLYALLVLGVLQAVQHRNVRLWGAMREGVAVVYGFIEERLNGREDTLANGGVPYVLRRLAQYQGDAYRAFFKAQLFSVFTFSITHLLFVLATALGLGLGIWLYQRGQVTIGTVYLIVYYLGILREPLEQMRSQVDELQQATASIHRVHELLALRPSVRDDDLIKHEEMLAVALPSADLAVEFVGVSFGYREHSVSKATHRNGTESESETNPEVKAVLRDVSFQVQAGEVLGLLGRTGSGKTTITRLFFRLYDPTQGAIRIGGRDLRTLKLRELRCHVGLVTQEVQLFQASLRDNITLFNTEISDDQILQVLDELGLWRWYEAQPQGLDTLLQASGAGLSAGQAQLLALVRVFLKDPGLVILDEASSRLDPATEQLLERAIDRLLAGRTAIIIAHRLGTVQRADHILILEDGCVAEAGVRADLAADPSSRFYRLLQTGMQAELA
ncbi:MAG: ABC transporter ATP-binding protein [Caldilineaceae bacterium]|nr:ABC transporter ATP-binding protein [Caldilineaceae bacterium]